MQTSASLIRLLLMSRSAGNAQRSVNVHFAQLRHIGLGHQQAPAGSRGGGSGGACGVACMPQWESTCRSGASGLHISMA